MQKYCRRLAPVAAALLALAAGACSDDKPKAAKPLTAGEVWQAGHPPATNSIGMKLMPIPAGKFIMGSPKTEEWRRGGENQREVAIAKPFYMAATQVTQKQWMAMMSSNPSDFVGDNLPVDSVSWNDAQDFCQVLSKAEGKNYRLPTEAEWEYACRAGTTGPYGGTGNLGEMGWYADNSGVERLASERLWDAGKNTTYYQKLMQNGCQTHPVGLKKPNAWGLYDMHGNVEQWCQDSYNATTRVLRGGSWSYISRDCRSAVRSGEDPGLRNFNIGLRVVLDVPE